MRPAPHFVVWILGLATSGCKPDDLLEMPPDDSRPPCRVAVSREVATTEYVRAKTDRLLGADSDEERTTVVTEVFQEVPDDNAACALVLQMAACLDQQSSNDELAGEVIVSLASTTCADAPVRFHVALEAFRVTLDHQGPQVASARAVADSPSAAAEAAARALAPKIINDWGPRARATATVYMPTRKKGSCLKVKLDKGSAEVRSGAFRRGGFKGGPSVISLSDCYGYDVLAPGQLGIRGPGTEEKWIDLQPGRIEVLELEPRAPVVSVQRVKNGSLASALVRAEMSEGSEFIVRGDDDTLAVLRSELREERRRIRKNPGVQQALRDNLGLDYLVRGTLQVENVSAE